MESPFTPAGLHKTETMCLADHSCNTLAFQRFFHDPQDAFL
ncbi:hypothetical protein SAMN05192573_1314 [Mucilaginibacter gossypii]|uniref:Uncharacterized protein n=1 Tax=Mucilaginibacter gossypii TaxID=551996 RepID=A0A1G8N5H9_9SPHI|nr:hypothetical protein SAMN05192573_1314 [Mucilaginibacter gossypii]